MAEARGNRTHRPVLPYRPTGFEDRGGHQPPFASIKTFKLLYYKELLSAINFAVSRNAFVTDDSG